MTPSKPTVIVATPCYGGLLSHAYVHSLLKLMGSSAQQAFNVALLTSADEAFITHGRSALVRTFLVTAAATHLLFIDPDIGFEPAAVERLFAFDAEVVAGMCPTKVADAPRMSAELRHEGTPDPACAPTFAALPCSGSEAEEREGFVTAKYVGAGFMMITRSAIERLIRLCPGANDAAPRATPSACAVFDCMTDPETGVWLSEGFAFCHRFRAIGGKVWLDVRTPFRQLGSTEPQAHATAGSVSSRALLAPARTELRAHPLQTARFLLAPIEPTDAAELWTAIDTSRAQLDRWLPTARFNTDVEASRRYAMSSAVDWDSGRACRFTIRDQRTRDLYGVVGLETFDHLQQSVELGYWLRSEATGHGIVTEACSALLTWAFLRLNVHRVRVATATDNHASLAVIRRLGFRFEGLAREVECCQGRRLDHAVFSLLGTDVKP